MNPLSPDLMTTRERLGEVCRLLALGLIRLRMRETGATPDHGSAPRSSELLDASGDGAFGFFGAPAAPVTGQRLSSKLKRVARSAGQQRDGGRP